MRNWGQVAFAGAVAGLIFCGTVLVLGTSSFWLACTLGFVAGYLAYEFNEVRDAASTFVWRLREGFRERREDVRQWLKDPHPYLLISSPVWLGSGSYVFYLVIAYIMQQVQPFWARVYGCFMASALVFVFTFIVALVASMFVWAFALFGADQEGVFYVEREGYTRTDGIYVRIFPSYQAEMANKDYVEMPFTYGNVFRWFVGGCFEAFFRAAVTWCGLIPAVIWIGSLLFQLLARIHSSKRLMCGFGGVIGGWISHAFFWSAEMSFWQAGLYLLAGALFGACVALLEWKASQFFARQTAPDPVSA